MRSYEAILPRWLYSEKILLANEIASGLPCDQICYLVAHNANKSCCIAF